ncbi:BON domain-containing protein [Leptolyngbya sp. FACHB-711]|uniref:BON domain-containing protein n=1 Tax=unclassified Leptolyngbya TaxID=2650499 RepID=UPI00168334DF|nr:BON domain-containing protein [Leptolyngbya sp. FACHB-711]MBD1848779.1 BON domain-containing protein [Cyanobacteria bacterium FACHB-502]MBD2022838.1 BON domain-containing protein [Leptolyngbya sp. FACHB-711]
MGWLQRLFGAQKPQQNQAQAQPQANVAAAAQGGNAATAAQGGQESIPPERVGLNGEYDQSGLAKRVALAFDQDPGIDDIDTVYVAQTGGTVVLKGKAPNQEIVQKMTSVARGVSGATNVDTSQVTVG